MWIEDGAIHLQSFRYCSGMGTRVLVLGATILTLFASSCSGQTKADKFIKDLYGTSGADVDFGCENLEHAAGLDWDPYLGFDLSELEAAWRKICN